MKNVIHALIWAIAILVTSFVMAQNGFEWTECGSKMGPGGPQMGSRWTQDRAVTRPKMAQ